MNADVDLESASRNDKGDIYDFMSNVKHRFGRHQNKMEDPLIRVSFVVR